MNKEQNDRDLTLVVLLLLIRSIIDIKIQSAVDRLDDSDYSERIKSLSEKAPPIESAAVEYCLGTLRPEERESIIDNVDAILGTLRRIIHKTLAEVTDGRQRNSS